MTSPGGKAAGAGARDGLVTVNTTPCYRLILRTMEALNVGHKKQSVSERMIISRTIMG